MIVPSHSGQQRADAAVARRPVSSARAVAVVSNPFGIASGVARKPSTAAQAPAISAGVGRPQS